MAQPTWMLSRGILGSGRTRRVSFRPFPNSSGWWWLAAAKSCQSCLTLCDPMDSSPPGSSVHGIFQARVLEWVAISFSNQHQSIFKKKNRMGKTRDLFWRRKWQPTSVFLPGESQGSRCLEGCYLWGCTELHMTEAT